MQSQKFRDTRTGEIVTQIPLTEIQHFDKYNGTTAAGDFDKPAKKADWIDSHVEIIGLPEGVAEKFKNRLRADL